VNYPFRGYEYDHAECFKGIVNFEIIFWYVLAYLKDIQDVGVFVSAVVFNFDIFKSNRSCLSVIEWEVYGHHLKEHAQRSPNLNMI